MSTRQLVIRERGNRLLVMALIAIGCMLFAAFTGAYLIRRTGADWKAVQLPGILMLTTAVIVVSSVTIEIARKTSSRGWIAVTLGLAILFLGGQILGWRALSEEGLADLRIAHSAFFVTLCCVHAVHLVGGLVALIFAQGRPSLLGVVAMYWHFVGAVWIYLYLLLSVVT